MFDFNMFVGIFNILAGVSTFVTALILILDYIASRQIPIHIECFYIHDDNIGKYRLTFGQLKHGAYRVQRIEIKSTTGVSCFTVHEIDDYGYVKSLPVPSKKMLDVNISVPPNSIQLDGVSFEFEAFGVESTTTLSVVVKNRLSIRESTRTINLYNI